MMLHLQPGLDKIIIMLAGNVAGLPWRVPGEGGVHIGEAHNWVLRVKFLDVQVFNIGDGIGEAPGDMLVVANDDAGRAWEADADDINITGDQVALIPDRRSCLPQVRVITEDG